MEQIKINILLEQVRKIDEVLQALEKNFDCDDEFVDEYSFLSIVKKGLLEKTDK